MSKSTNLIIAVIGLGGLGYFLYKRGLFSNKSATTVVDTKLIPSPAPTPTPIPVDLPLDGALRCGDGTKALLPQYTCGDVNGINTRVLNEDFINYQKQLEKEQNPVEYVADINIGKPSLQNQVPANTYQNDPFIDIYNNNVGSVNKNINQLLYL
jgi:hypothetical protein